MRRLFSIIACILYVIIYNGCVGVAYEKKLEKGFYLPDLDTNGEWAIM